MGFVFARESDVNKSTFRAIGRTIYLIRYTQISQVTKPIDGID